MSARRTRVQTLTLGTAILLAYMVGADLDQRPPVGARAAIEMIANKPGRRLAQVAPWHRDNKINAFSMTNQGPLRAGRVLL